MTTDEDYKRPLLYHHAYPGPPPDRSTAPSPFKIDEGFSEETRSQTASEAAFGPEPIPIDNTTEDASHAESVRQWLLAQPVELRTAIARDLLSSIPTSFLSDLVDEANGRLHFDPVRCLPQEIISNIFEFLDPSSLVHASLVSRLWRYHAFEPRLWRRLFGLEGWSQDPEKLRSFERRSRSQIRNLWSSRKPRPRPRDSSIEGSDIKRFRRSVPPFEDIRDNSRLWVQNGAVGMPPEWSGAPLSNDSTVMEQDDPVSLVRQESETDEEMKDATDDLVADGSEAKSSSSNSSMVPESSSYPPITPLLDTVVDSPQPNWQHLYKQRRRLEQNWSAGHFTPFRLPHPDFTSEEAHRQCVYTLQFTAKHLVSGSRDKTIRIWDLNTQRLKCPPLTGHQGSVLCLQFDEKPEQDVIISGGSDSDVIIWKFSTGTMERRLANAHSESVLNLRFDDRYLVTCSKDKTIKLWNRRSLKPTDPEYPQTNRSQNAYYPAYIVNVADLVTGQVVDALDPYTLLMTFDQHNAAVNAIQIFENEIVSASGDRKIMLWDIRTGTLIRTFLGHSKGIACVQYDGRRIISGSSDNSVRIFDSATTAELAVLDGHENLVRTVQADFGDLPGDASALEAEARENDRRIMEKKEQRLRNGQSDVWDEPFVYGAKLPPSGGGNRWSKIVSGSYDESVIIWRKDENGKWVAAKQLRQEDAMRATAPPGERQLIPVETWEARARSSFVGVRSGPPFPITSSPTHIFQQAQALGMPPNLSTRDGVVWMQRNLLISRTAWGYIQFFRLRVWNLSSNANQPDANAAPSAPSQLPSAATPPHNGGQQPSASSSQPAHLHPNHPHYQYLPPTDPHRQIPAMPRVNAQLRQPQLQAQLHHRLAQHIIHSSRDVNLQPGPSNVPVAHAPPRPHQQQPQQQHDMHTGQGSHQTAPPSTGDEIQLPNPPPENSRSQQQFPAQPPPLSQVYASLQLPGQGQGQPQPPAAQAQQPPQAQNQPANGHHDQGIPSNQDGGLSRVFKLQFDARRIICCSQQPIIVGWDFANGDKDIEEASQFFDAAQQG